MLRILKIMLNNFGPYKGRQELVFPSTDGVVLVYGENMRGKTTLLNAFRYALFGTFLGRGQSQIPISRIGNWEASEEGQYGFSVELEFAFGADLYNLIRTCRPRDPTTKPLVDSDFVQESFLKRDGSHLSDDEARHQLSLMMPEEVSRFFLFDGELLQQYEELVRVGSEKGDQIKASIERILGLPILTNGRFDFTELLNQAAKREAKAATANQKTQALGTASESLLAKQDGHRKEIVRMHGEIEDLRQRKVAKEDELRRFEKARALLLTRDELTKQRDHAERELQGCRDRLRELMTDAWRVALAPRLRIRRNDLEEEILSLRVAEEKRAFAAKMTQELEAALTRERCYVCEHELDTKSRLNIQDYIKSLNASVPTESRKSELTQLEKQLSGLADLQGTLTAAVLIEVQDRLDEARVRVAELKARIEDNLEQTRNVDESEVRRAQSEHDQIVREIGSLEEGSTKEQWELADAAMRLQKIQADLQRLAGHDLERHRQRRELCEKLRDLFALGVDTYRDRLREKVQTDATDLFLQLTTEEEYQKLVINESYGLNIVHLSGQLISVRSAGAEHIVALSLMGALQKNAPLSGPIIMDSPFGRLDSAHTKRVVEALPVMASQVMLLVYESELQPDLAREVLAGKLRREYRIVRKSARHSSLERQV